jgi:cell division protease FtsH
MAKSPLKQNPQTRLTMLIVGILVLFIVFQLSSPRPEDVVKLDFSDFLAATDKPESSSERIVEVTFKETEITGKLQDGSRFKTFGPYDPELRKELTDKGIRVTFQPPDRSPWWQEALIHWVPVLFIVFLIFFIMRQLQIGGGKAMSFGKSRAKLHQEGQTNITFKDVAGVDEAKEELVEIVEFLKEPKKFTKLGGKIPKGVLLIGPPGTGKTLLAKAIAGEAGVPFFSISGSDFVEMFVGVGASRVRDMFDQAKKNAPCIVFIDEIDAVGRHRGAGMGGGHDEREQTLNQLLVEMDGFEGNDGVILVAATNRVDVLDPALLRPGRFDRRVIVGNPDVKGREEILKVHTRKSPLSADVNLRTIAQGTPGFSGADLQNLVNEAALLAARAGKDLIDNSFFESAKDKVLMGPARKSMVFSEKERKTTAYHEAGHAVVAKNLKEADPVHKVTIVPRGMALGVTMLLPSEDRLSMSKNQAIATITYAMGGRAAEEIIFDHFTTGASDDIKKATNIARKMVCSWGMSETLGPVNFGKENADPFLGRDIQRSQSYSEKVAEQIDTEVNSILNNAYVDAKNILNEKRGILEHLTEALLIYETIEGADLEKILSGGKVDLNRPKVEEPPKVTTQKNEVTQSDEKTITADLKPATQGT